MVCQWKPDTCNCVILYDGKTFEVIDQFKNKKTIACKQHEELKGQDLLNFVIPENQTSNEFYLNFTPEEMEKPETQKLIREYKKVFTEVSNLDPIRNLSLTDSVKLFRG